MGQAVVPYGNQSNGSLLGISWRPSYGQCELARLFHPEDCQSKTLGAADLLIDENIDRISSVLRKEIEGNLIIANDSLPGYLEEGKDSLEESFVDAKDDMA